MTPEADAIEREVLRSLAILLDRELKKRWARESPVFRQGYDTAILFLRKHLEEISR